MNVRGRTIIPAGPTAVWTALHDPAVLAACVPGIEAVTYAPDGQYRGRLTTQIGPLKVRFDGAANWRETAPPDGAAQAAILTGTADGGPAGSVRGRSTLTLVAEGVDTVLTYEAVAEIGGKLAQLGEPLLQSAANDLANAFFARLAAALRPAATPQTPARQATPQPSPARPRPELPVEEGLGPQIWVAGLIGIVVILLILFSITL